MANKINKSYALQTLKEEYDASEDKKLGVSLRKYVELTSESDPNFFRWIFNCEDIADFGTNLTDEQKEEYKDFLDTLGPRTYTSINDDAKAMNEFREKILSDKYYCFGWCYTWNADPGCLEDDASIDEFREEIENNAIVEITDPEDREIALRRLNAELYDGPVYCAGGVTFIANN